jgi:hypothetical protein
MTEGMEQSRQAVHDAHRRLAEAEEKRSEASVLAARLRALRRRGLAHLFVEAIRGARG